MKNFFFLFIASPNLALIESSETFLIYLGEGQLRSHPINCWKGFSQSDKLILNFDHQQCDCRTLNWSFHRTIFHFNPVWCRPSSSQKKAQKQRHYEIINYVIYCTSIVRFAFCSKFRFGLRGATEKSLNKLWRQTFLIIGESFRAFCCRCEPFGARSWKLLMNLSRWWVDSVKINGDGSSLWLQLYDKRW